MRDRVQARPFAVDELQFVVHLRRRPAGAQRAGVRAVEDERDRRRINVEQQHARLTQSVGGLHSALAVDGSDKLVLDRQTSRTRLEGRRRAGGSRGHTCSLHQLGRERWELPKPGGARDRVGSEVAGPTAGPKRRPNSAAPRAPLTAGHILQHRCSATRNVASSRIRHRHHRRRRVCAPQSTGHSTHSRSRSTRSAPRSRTPAVRATPTTSAEPSCSRGPWTPAPDY